ncbi:MAG: carbon-nitrogen hydrolase family protein [Gammaproteobacteria bacterium]|nr:carbon-nitrogen hydrolase family protein [Gammaproteobacteria bacterium]
MSDVYPRIRVAAIQAAPIFLKRDATVEKACALIRQAAGKGASIIGFPEGFIPGHPLWYHFHPATSSHSMKLATELFKNSVEIPSPATEALCHAAREANVHVVMGLCERRPGTFGTMYNTQLFIDDQGQILGKHQKLVPTVGERLVHTGGYGDTLRAFQTKFGKISGLICGENSNPLAIFALIAEGTMIHVASWPNHRWRGAKFPASDRATSAGRAVAMMSKAFVLNVLGALNEEMMEMLAANDEDHTFLRDPNNSGGSTIIGPQSTVIAGPMNNEEGDLYADIDLEACVREKVTHDLAGHYNRADIFNVRVNRTAPSLYQPYVTAADEVMRMPVTNRNAIDEVPSLVSHED